MSTISNNLKHNALSLHNDLLASIVRKENSVVLLSHFGNFDQSKINVLINLIEQSILEQGIKRKVMKRVCSVLIENFQNISIHASRDNKGNHNASFILAKVDDELRMFSGNMLHVEDVGAVNFKLSQINKLSLDEIRKLYIETLCNETFSDKGGAGLGFLTIAKKVELPIQYQVKELDANHSYFSSKFSISAQVQ